MLCTQHGLPETTNPVESYAHQPRGDDEMFEIIETIDEDFDTPFTEEEIAEFEADIHELIAIFETA